jgi:ferredoxin
MARIEQRLPQNAAGDLFVDAMCIDCDACRAIAPQIFRDHGGQSSVLRQPASDAENRRAMMALVSWWTVQTRSMEKLLAYKFSWVLPGHGRIGHAAADEMKQHLAACVERMKLP